MDTLVTKKLSKHFGGIKAVDGVSISVKKQTITALIGPNGSGKTTLFNLISGFYEPDKGKVFFLGKDVTKLKSYQIANKGLVRTFQIVRIFRNISVIENMLVAPKRTIGDSFVKSIINYKKSIQEEKESYDYANELLDLLELSHLKDEYAANLSGGQLKLLSIGIALMRDPEILLLDEPVAGVNPTLANKIFDILINCRDKFQKTFFIIEHNMDVVLDFSDLIYVMSRGKIIAEGNPEEIFSNRGVIDAYLGVD
jgi:ABC-type branched-subunit amino acid transport system ATPase component